MANNELLKSSIRSVIKANGNEEITGDILQQTLVAIVDALGKGYQFMGVATPTTDPGTIDQKVFYIANGKGLYKNFGGINIDEDEVVLLIFKDTWTKVSTGIASNSKLLALFNDVDNVKTDVGNVKNAVEALKSGKVTDNRVLAEALVSLEARISALEGGKPYLGNATAGVIDVNEITRARYPLVMVAHGVPAKANVPDNLPAGLPWDGVPAFVGQQYVNLDAPSGGFYYATGNQKVSDWKQA